ncbi:hypothetical protein ACFE04_031721 [Oxalis oulophora]
MESNEDSKSLSDETDESDEQDQIGTGRSYECVFCKRGFTTAQALGGHMNIHRKDRAKTRRPNNLVVPSNIHKGVDDDNNYNYVMSSNNTNNFGSYINNPFQSYSTASHHVKNYQSSFFPAPTWLVNAPPFEETWSEDLRLQLGPTPLLDDDEEKRQEDGLDLELRLGHT